MPAANPSLPPTKKRKIAAKENDRIERIQRLENLLLKAVSAGTSLNPLVDLLDIAKNAKDPHLLFKCIYALYRVFASIIDARMLVPTPDVDAKIVRTWISERLNIFTDMLVGLMSDPETSLRTSAIQILFSLLKHLSSSLSPDQDAPGPSTSSGLPFHVPHFNKIILGLLECPPGPRSSCDPSARFLDPGVLEVFTSSWFNAYDDVRWFFLRDAATFVSKCQTESHPHVVENFLSILECLKRFPGTRSDLNRWWIPQLGKEPPPLKTSKGSVADDEEEELEIPEGDEDDWRKFFDEPESTDKNKKTGPNPRLHKMTVQQSLHSLQSHKAVFSRAWMILLPRLPRSGDVEATKALATRVLNMMHGGVMPRLTRPVLIMDWIGSCVDYGGTIGLLALNALFILIRDYNLDYPSFYTRLYAFLDRDLLHNKHRARFFRLTELFLSSTHLPAALLASFIKRLSRLSISSPPAGIIMVIPFTYNILKRHPALMYMINRVDDVEEPDPFDPEEKDPMLTNALDSSLWELVSHGNHYHPSVSTLAKIFQEAFRKPNYALEDFLDHTYGTLFESDAKRKIKKDPAVAMELKKYLFITEDQKEQVPEGAISVQGDVVTELWTF